jgi:hypothetical protein
MPSDLPCRREALEYSELLDSRAAEVPFSILLDSRSSLSARRRGPTMLKVAPPGKRVLIRGACPTTEPALTTACGAAVPAARQADRAAEVPSLCIVRTPKLASAQCSLRTMHRVAPHGKRALIRVGVRSMCLAHVTDVTTSKWRRCDSPHGMSMDGSPVTSVYGVEQRTPVNGAVEFKHSNRSRRT